MVTVTERDIQELAERIVAEFRPRKIILFGSRAYGTPHEDSDVDLLVVMDGIDDRLKTAADMLARVHPRSFAVDLLLRTPDEMRWRYIGGDPFIGDAVDFGRVLYEVAA